MTDRDTVRVRITPEVIESLFTRDYLGNRLRVDWGEPDAEGFHEPVVSVDYADNLVAAERERIRAAVEVLPKWDKRSVPGGFHVNRAAVLAIIDREDA